MTARQQRRQKQKAERKARKLEQRRQNALGIDVIPTDEGPAARDKTTPALPSRPVSDRKCAANRANAQFSTGPTSIEGKQIVSQNRIRHGLTGNFQVLPDECQADFDRLIETLLDEHEPADATEAEFVQQMAEALWLSRRSVRLQDRCILALRSEDPAEQRAAHKDLALFMRYQTTHDRAFVRYSTELRKRRNERRRIARGFESQKAREAQQARRKVLQLIREAAEIRKQERHEATMRLANAKCERLELLNRASKSAPHPISESKKVAVMAA